MVERDLAERCRRAMAALPETDRRIAFLCFSEGLDSRETGRALGMPAGTVRWRLSRIRER
jgi:DNA-directed RNA polymerase specialized sigma24 family protein